MAAIIQTCFCLLQDFLNVSNMWTIFSRKKFCSIDLKLAVLFTCALSSGSLELKFFCAHLHNQAMSVHTSLHTNKMMGVYTSVNTNKMSVHTSVHINKMMIHGDTWQSGSFPFIQVWSFCRDGLCGRLIVHGCLFQSLGVEREGVTL